MFGYISPITESERQILNPTPTAGKTSMMYEILGVVKENYQDVHKECKIEAYDFNELIDKIKVQFGWNPDIRNISVMNYIDRKSI